MFSPIARITTISTNVFREVIRDRVLYLLVLYGIVMMLAVRLIPEVAAATERKILPDLGLALMQVMGLLLAVFVGTNLVNKEIEKRTVLVLVAKPVSRTEFIFGKHLGLTGVLGVLVIIMTGIYVAVMTLGKVAVVPQELLVHGLFLWLQLSLVTAIALLFGVFTGPILGITMTFGVYLMGTLSRDMVTFAKLAKNPDLERIAGWLYLILPDMGRLDLKNQVVYHLIPDQMSILKSGGYGLLYIMLVLNLTALVFSRREF
jgi:ABC-type transport system involved in multi-copper enzyme maturation permease subunit